MKNLFYIFICFLFACGSSSPQVELNNGADFLSDLPEETPEPLEEVEIPSRENPPEEARIFQLQIGAPAPFSGLLFSPEASAFIVTEYQALQERYQLSLDTQRNMDYARIVRISHEYRLQINSDRQRFRLILESRERYEENLETIINNNNSFWNDFWKISGAAGVGLVIGISLGFVFASTN